METLPVNKVLEKLTAYEQKYIYLDGLLNYEFEGNCINHWPKKEQNHINSYESSIYILPAPNFDFEDKVMSKWSGKRVVVGGTVLSPEAHLGGCGHMSLWPAEIIITQIKLYKDWVAT